MWLVGRVGGPIRRVWAYACLAHGVQGSLDPSVVVLGAPEVHGTSRIRLGRDLYLYPGLYLETRLGGEISIGDHAVISRGVHVVSYASVRIGAGAMIGEYTSIRDANHRIGEGKPLRDSGHDARPIVIGENVWLGARVTVTPGVTIGDNVVVGANSVVTRDVAPGELVVGAPARPLRKRSEG